MVFRLDLFLSGFQLDHHTRILRRLPCRRSSPSDVPSLDRFKRCIAKGACHLTMLFYLSLQILIHHNHVLPDLPSSYY